MAPAVFQSTGLIASARNWTIDGGGGTINVPAAADNMSISGNFYQFGAFVKSGAGQLTLSGQLTAAAASTFSIAAGSVVMAQNTATYEQIVAPSTQTGFVGDLYLNGPFRFAVLGGNVAGGGHVYVEGNNSGIYADTPVGGAAGTVTTITNPVILNSTGLPNTTASPFTSFLGCSTAGDELIINGAGVSGNANVVFTNDLATGGGAGEVALNVANSWAGSTTVDMGGPIVLGVTNGIPSGTALTFGSGHGGVWHH